MQPGRIDDLCRSISVSKLVVSTICAGQYQFLNNNVVSDDIARTSDIPEIRQPYIDYVEVRKANTEAFQASAPNAKSGYKFLCWVIVTTAGAVASWNPENPDKQTTKFWCVNTSFDGTVRCFALYVPN